MAYGVKYRIQYYRRYSGKQTTIDILEKDHISSAITELRAAEDPLTILFDGDPSNIYKPTIGSGAVIRIVETPLTLLGLFTDDPQKYMVRIFDGIANEDSDVSSDTDGKLIWQGFINAEIYSEGYSNPIATTIELNCNDGLALLDKIKYKTAADEYYEGTEDLAHIFQNIFGKLGIEFDRIFMNCDFSLTASPSLNTNLFDFLMSSNENFVDESGEPMSCRDVLNSIIGGLGLVMKFSGRDIHIIDPINLHDASKTKVYDISASYDTELASNELGGYLDISSQDVAWGLTGSVLDIEPAIDEAIVVYDPYTFTLYEYDFNKESNQTVEGTWSDMGAYWYNENVQFLNWIQGSANEAASIGLRETETGPPTYCLHMNDSQDYLTFTLPDYNSIVQDEFLQIRISFQVWVQTKDSSLNIFADDSTAAIIWQYKVPIIVRIGDLYWQGGNTWDVAASPQPMVVRQADVSESSVTHSQVNDRWTEGYVLVPLWNSGQRLFGNLKVYIFDELTTAVSEQVLPAINDEFVYHVLLKDFKIEIVNVQTGKIISNDRVKTKAVMSTNLTGKESTEIEVTSGTGLWGTSKAAYKTTLTDIPGIAKIEGLYRGTEATSHKTADLFLQSFQSQYKTPRIKIRGRLRVQDYLLDIRKYLIQDTNHMGDRAFYILNGEYHDREEMMDVEMIEVTGTRETI